VADRFDHFPPLPLSISLEPYDTDHPHHEIPHLGDDLLSEHEDLPLSLALAHHLFASQFG
jgi:hypothetical protein